jgi:alkanesulfonate monooxygenase SsuD/methylene tetrahydromethanopterin reductase-like flavin-dependent oxidoreductase (luciferase family)
MEPPPSEAHAHAMKVRTGLHLTNFSFPGVAETDRLDHAVAIAVAAEEAGFDTLWVNDHLIEGQPPNQGAARPETYVFLATAAAHTSTIRLGALASSIFFRNPALLARMVVTLDQASRGRAILGVGAGHPMTEGEHQMFGLDFPAIKLRMDRLEAVLPDLRRLVGGTIPIMVAGSGEHRLLRIVARYGDMCNLSMPSGDTLEMVRHKLDVLQSHCLAVEREYSTITKTYKAVLSMTGPEDADFRLGLFTGDADHVREGAQAFVDAGIDEVIVQIKNVHDLKAISLAGQALAGLRPRHAEPRAASGTASMV